MSGCCHEYNCRRKKPMMLMRSDLTDRWYVVTDYTDRGGGNYRASTKHLLPQDKQDQLEDLRDGHAAAARADRLVEKAERDGIGDPVVFLADLRHALSAEGGDAS